ncbi:MAG: hypothetical protein IJ193_02060 [Bacilli bacterium]|nr:hypothetical protein [Bacilli bacterium]
MNKKNIILIVFILGILLIVSGFSLNLISNNGNGTKEKKDDKTSVQGQSTNSPDTNKLKQNEDGTLSNENEKIAKKHVNGDFSVEDMSITVNKDLADFATYHFTLKNNGTKDYQSFEVSIVFKFKDGTQYVDAPHKVDALATGGSVELERVVFGSIANAVDYEIRVKTTN